MILRQGQAGSVLYGAGILAPYIVGSDLNIEHGGADVGVTHEELEGGQRDSGANHIRSKSVPETVGIGPADVTLHAVVAEQGAESGDG